MTSLVGASDKTSGVARRADSARASLVVKVYPMNLKSRRARRGPQNHAFTTLGSARILAGALGKVLKTGCIGADSLHGFECGCRVRNGSWDT